MPMEVMLGGSAPVVAGQDFKPTMSVPAGVDKNQNGIEDGFDSEIGDGCVRVALWVVSM